MTQPVVTPAPVDPSAQALPTAEAAAPAEPVVVPAPDQPAAQESSEGFLGVKNHVYKYAGLAALLYIIVSSPMMYTLTAKFTAQNGCPTIAGVFIHAVVFGILVCLFTCWDCIGKTLTRNEHITLVASAAVTYVIVNMATRYMCMNPGNSKFVWRVINPSFTREARQLSESGSGSAMGATDDSSKMIVPMLAGGVAYFVIAVAGTVAYDKFVKKEAYSDYQLMEGYGYQTANFQ